ncbi:Hypothetical predicted protein [Pelobates cultripes]|uniref:FAM21/CAPZIP domain-containing protein n=1 Tax=Pelobates cultripes TaxID=61616 RepID=A0AAD1QYN8_PELCU|nr:Hypothetical predicted protein [Pelobates cultripes]
MEGKSEETNSTEESPAPSVAKLAGIFGNQLNSPKKEIPPHKPTRRKPPCSLPLHTNRAESTQNAEEKVSPQAPHLPKIKVKSSPLIEKLQANLAFAPAPFLPGGGPLKSPGLKVMASPFSSPSSSPTSPGVQSRSSETEEVPISFEQPPEGAHLQSVTKVRTRGSIKRRPPSRRFRKSQSDIGYEDDLGGNTTPKLNGDKKEEEDNVFDATSKSTVDKDGNEMETTQETTGDKPAEKSPESITNDPETSEEPEVESEISNEGGIEDKVGEQDCNTVEEKDKGIGEEAANETDIQKQPNVTRDHANGNESESPEKETDNQESQSRVEEKTDAEK